MKYLVLVCLFLLLAGCAAFTCHCKGCDSGEVCVGTDPHKDCQCVPDHPATKRRHGVVRKRKLQGKRKNYKPRAKKLRKGPMRKRVKPENFHRKRASRTRN